MLVFNEVDNVCGNPLEVQACVLSLEKRAQLRQLYVGSDYFGPLPAIGYMDTNVPAVFKNNRQIARRVIDAPLGAELVGDVDWRKGSGGEIEG